MQVNRVNYYNNTGFLKSQENDSFFNFKKYFKIEGPRRMGRHRFKKIVIPIAKLPLDLTLTYDNLPKIFGLANQYTMNTRYPLINNSLDIDGIAVHRPNHNGTHSVRQVRYVEELMNLIESKGTQRARAALASLSQEERLNLLLAAYFLRSGRVDESSHKSQNPDPYPYRSALIYESYAKQLGISLATIEWGKTIVANACLPKEERDAVINEDPKHMLGYQLLSMGHELDLVRCMEQGKIENETKRLIRNQINYFVGQRHDASKDFIVEKLIKFSKDLCLLTGCRVLSEGIPYNEPLFARCSTDGAYCWSRVQSRPVFGKS